MLAGTMPCRSLVLNLTKPWGPFWESKDYSGLSLKGLKHRGDLIRGLCFLKKNPSGSYIGEESEGSQRRWGKVRVRIGGQTKRWGQSRQDVLEDGTGRALWMTRCAEKVWERRNDVQEDAHPVPRKIGPMMMLFIKSTGGGASLRGYGHEFTFRVDTSIEQWVNMP